MTEVVAALIWDKDTFMICQRPEYKPLGLHWEFVGGKVEPGETKKEALVRECKEELDINISVGEEFCSVEYEYPHIAVHLTMFNASIIKGTPKLLEHKDLKWIRPKDIPLFQFCHANTDILNTIMANAKKANS